MKEKNKEVARRVRSAANNMDVLLIALDSIAKSIDDTAEHILESQGETHGFFAYSRELSSLQNLLQTEMEDLETLADKLEKEGKR